MHKSGRFFQAFLEESLKLFSAQRHGSITFNPVSVLLLMKKNPIFEEIDCKRYTLIVFYSSYLEMIFALLTKVIAFYI